MGEVKRRVTKKVGVRDEEEGDVEVRRRVMKR